MNKPHINHRPQGRTGGAVTWVIGVGIAGIALVGTLILIRSMGSDGQAPAAERVAHVHGLDVDATDGVLHVATHNGLYRMPDDGPVERISEDQHDFMGFTVAGPHRFLASGHPGIGTEAFQELDRPLFGLIESTDGGRSWDPVSLSGEVDFHGLEAAHGNVYGFDSTSGRLLVSTDEGTTWDNRSSISIADLAVDPADEDHIIVSTGEGLAERGLWGLDARGTVHRLDGGSWQVVKELAGTPQALLAHDGGVAVAVDDGSTVIQTTRDGQDWSVVYRDEPAH